jgi:NAD-dependent deacetylase
MKDRILPDAPGNQPLAARLAEYLAAAERIAVLSGAGMSTESGIPDFRSANGIYRTIVSEDIFDIEAFRRNPERFYVFARTFFGELWAAEPNAGHHALARLEAEFGKRVDIATQNIDTLHQQAGSTRVHPLHGTIDSLSCPRCGAECSSLDARPELEAGKLPRCACGAVWKPDIVFFGEMLPERAMADALAAMRRADLVLVLGTSLAVYPAAMLPSHRPPSARLVLVNLTPTPLDREADLVCRESAGALLGQAIDILAGTPRPALGDIA